MPWVSVCTILYGCVTVMPIFRHDSPYHTPLLLAAWHIVTGMSFVAFRALRRFTSNCCCSIGYIFLCHLEGRCFKLLEQGMQKTAEATALNLPSEIDTQAFLWTFDSLDEDHELERFFSGLPGFRNSKVVDDPLPRLNFGQADRLSTALIRLFDRTFSSDLLPEPVKRRRALICAKAIDSRYTPQALVIIDRILFGYQQSGLVTEIVRIMRGWGNNGNKDSILYTEVTVSRILAMKQQRGDSWFIFASNELGVPEAVLRDYATHDNNLSLAILTHIIRLRWKFLHIWERWSQAAFFKVLRAASKFNVRDTSPGLQHEFCALWNHIVFQAQDKNYLRATRVILGPIRNVYIALHRDTDAAPTRFSASTSDYDEILSRPSSYPLCDLPCHHPGSTPHNHDNSASKPVVLHDNATLVPASHARPDVPSSSTSSTPPTPNNLTDVPPLDSDIYLPGSLRLAHQTAIENLRIPATSQNPVTARVMQGGSDTSTTATPRSTPESSASTLPTSMASTSPHCDVVQNITDSLTSPDVLDIPSLPSPTTVLENMFSPGLQSSLDSPVTRSDHASSSPESPSSLLSPTSTAASHPRLSSAPYSGTAAEEEGRAKAALLKEKDALHSSSAIREDMMTAADHPKQSLSLPQITDIAIVGPSRRSLGPEHTGGHPPHPSFD